MKKVVFGAVLVCALCALTPAGQWDAGQRNAILTSAEQALDTYVFPENVPKIRAAIESHRAELVKVSDPKEFADLVSKALYRASRDQHLQVAFSADPLPTKMKAPMQDKARVLHEEETEDFGYIDSARLDGNIGYLRVDWFSPAEQASTMLGAAMKLLSHTDALIIDLRSNDGGAPQSVDELLGYFIPAHTQVTGFLMRIGDKMVSRLQYASVVDGPRYASKPLYILTSGDTFSAAEQFAYDLQSLHRATIVGETTGGGANIGGPMRLSDHFMLFVPHGVARNPYTHTNWDGKGVQPDVRVKASTALLTAYTSALKAPNDQAGQERLDALKNPEGSLRKAFALP